MATLRKWQPARVVPQRSKTPERVLICMMAATVGYFAWTITSPQTKPDHAPVARIQTPAQLQRAERERERAALAAAREKHNREQAERAPHVANLKAEQARAQAVMFEQRHGSDRMPVGSVNAGEPVPPRSPGFTEVKPGLAATMPGASQPAFGFREIRKWSPGN